MQIFIAGTDRTNIIDFKTLRIEDAINERSIATFTLNDLSNIVDLHRGQTVEMIHEGEKVFGGTIDRIVKQKPPGGTIEREYKVECVDYHQIADRRIVAEAYDNKTVGYIVNNIITKYLSNEGITAANVQEGPIIVRAVFNYIKASQALDELSELVGYSWWIDADKGLHFTERATYAAPWALDNISLINNLMIDENREEYLNRQYIRAGQDISDPRTERFKGDGETRTFAVAFPIAKMPTITVNGNPQTVKIGQVEAGQGQWYWNSGEKTFYQDDSEPVLTSSDTVEITYQGFFPIIVVANEETAQAERKAVEGGTGIYESVEEAANIDSGEAAMEYAKGKLRRYARLGKKIHFNTWHSGIKPGQILSVSLPERNLEGEYLIQNVTFTRIGGRYWRYDVTAVSGEAVGGWAQFFRKLVQKGQTFVIRENEVLIRLVQFRDRVVCGDSMTVSGTAPESRVGYAMIGFSEIA